MWWERVTKKQIRKLLVNEGAMRRREDLAMGNLYHASFNELLKSPTPHGDKIAAVNHIMAKII